MLCCVGWLLGVERRGGVVVGFETSTDVRLIYLPRGGNLSISESRTPTQIARSSHARRRNLRSEQQRAPVSNDYRWSKEPEPVSCVSGRMRQPPQAPSSNLAASFDLRLLRPFQSHGTSLCLHDLLHLSVIVCVRDTQSTWAEYAALCACQALCVEVRESRWTRCCEVIGANLAFQSLARCSFRCAKLWPETWLCARS